MAEEKYNSQYIHYANVISGKILIDKIEKEQKKAFVTKYKEIVDKEKLNHTVTGENVENLFAIADFFSNGDVQKQIFDNIKQQNNSVAKSTSVNSNNLAEELEESVRKWAKYQQSIEDHLQKISQDIKDKYGDFAQAAIEYYSSEGHLTVEGAKTVIKQFINHGAMSDDLKQIAREKGLSIVDDKALVTSYIKLVTLVKAMEVISQDDPDSIKEIAEWKGSTKTNAGKEFFETLSGKVQGYYNNINGTLYEKIVSAAFDSLNGDQQLLKELNQALRLKGLRIVTDTVGQKSVKTEGGNKKSISKADVKVEIHYTTQTGMRSIDRVLCSFGLSIKNQQFNIAIKNKKTKIHTTTFLKALENTFPERKTSAIILAANIGATHSKEDIKIEEEPFKSIYGNKKLHTKTEIDESWKNLLDLVLYKNLLIAIRGDAQDPAYKAAYLVYKNKILSISQVLQYILDGLEGKGGLRPNITLQIASKDNNGKLITIYRNRSAIVEMNKWLPFKEGESSNTELNKATAIERSKNINSDLVKVLTEAQVTINLISALKSIKK